MVLITSELLLIVKTDSLSLIRFGFDFNPHSHNYSFIPFGLSTLCLFFNPLLTSYPHRADLMDNDSIDTLLAFKPSWDEELLKWTNKKQETAKQDASACKLRLSFL